MRKEPQSPWSVALDRVRTPWGRARRWLASLNPATRVGLILASLAVVGSVGYLAAGERTPGSVPATPLYEGQRLSNDDMAAIETALDAESIFFRSDYPSHRIFVRTDRKAAALAVIIKHKATPATLNDLNREDDPESPAWMLTAAERDRRERHHLEKILKRQIEGLDDPIISAQVTIIRDRVRGSLDPRANVHASVDLLLERGRKLKLQTVESIETFLVSKIPDLKPDAITVIDQTGHKYLGAGDAPLKEEVRKHSREEEWSEKIAEGLRHIPGVGVMVTLESVAVAAPMPVEPPTAPLVEGTVSNRPFSVAPEPRFIVALPLPPTLKTHANVWVRVPRSFYLLAAQSQTPNRTPSAEDLQLMQTTTNRIVHEAVDASIPKEMQGDIRVATVQDDLAVSRNLILPPESTPSPLWPIPAVAASGVGLALLASVVTGLRIAAKRPTLRPASAWRPGFVADEPNPGPSERVRELIRLNPEAAAGVLQRWIGQGGAVG